MQIIQVGQEEMQYTEQKNQERSPKTAEEKITSWQNKIENSPLKEIGKQHGKV